jgi:dihydrofolate reductase
MELSVNTFLSLDGVMQGPGGPSEDPSGGFDRGGWMVPFTDEDFGPIVGDWFARTGSVLLGRSTFQMMRDYWTTVTDPGNPAAVVLNTYPKYLVSRTITEPDWGDTTVISGDVVEEVRRLKEHPGRELQVHGSWRLARTLHDAGLVDVYRLLIFPVVLGTGKRLFPEGSLPTAFDVTETHSTSAGATALTLRPRPISFGTFLVEDGREADA